MREPEIRSQKLLYCRQIANQLAPVFPLCAMYTMDVAAEAEAVTRPSITLTTLTQTSSESFSNVKNNGLT